MIHQKFQVLVSEKGRLMSASQSEFTLIGTRSNKASRRDYSSEPARKTCVANLHAMTKHPQESGGSELFVVEAGIGQIMLKTSSEQLQLSDIQTKDGSRIWIDVFLHDLSGGVSCKMGEALALELTGCSDSDGFLQAMKKGKNTCP